MSPPTSIYFLRSRLVAWAGVVPFFLFAFFFLFAPSSSLFFDSFRNAAGQFTFENILTLVADPKIRASYALSLQISLATAVLGGLLGLLLAYAITRGGLPAWTRSSLITFAGVASNFAGVPLAFAFLRVLGNRGMVTLFLEKTFNIELQGLMYGFWGLSLTYLYFQFPLMILIMAPALDGLRREWREGAENLGASYLQYWWHVALPILLPSILGTMILLFGNAFGAYATAFALTGGSLNLVTIQIGAQMRGDVLHNPNLGYALALGMVIIMSVSLVLYLWLQRQSERWLR